MKKLDRFFIRPKEALENYNYSEYVFSLQKVHQI